MKARKKLKNGNKRFPICRRFNVFVATRYFDFAAPGFISFVVVVESISPKSFLIFYQENLRQFEVFTIYCKLFNVFLKELISSSVNNTVPTRVLFLKIVIVLLVDAHLNS